MAHDPRVQAIIDKLRAELPPIILGTMIDDLTGHAIAWGTIQNKRSRGEIENEDEIFFRSGNRVLIIRDPFLDWWALSLSQARRPPVLPARRPPRRQQRANATAASPGPDPPAL